jgi:hypothetical protein
MPKLLRRFVRGLSELAEYFLALKQHRCPECGATETLNCHSKLYGKDPDSREGGLIQRGQRMWCCNRGQRGGCGRTFSVFVAQVLPRHTMGASALWSLLKGLVEGGSIKGTFEALRLPFALESAYHLLHRVRERLTNLRAVLCREQKPPTSSQIDPLLQTVEHLRHLFARSDCPTAEFQLHFQRPLLE